MKTLQIFSLEQICEIYIIFSENLYNNFRIAKKQGIVQMLTLFRLGMGVKLILPPPPFFFYNSQNIDPEQIKFCIFPFYLLLSKAGDLDQTD